MPTKKGRPIAKLLTTGASATPEQRKLKMLKPLMTLVYSKYPLQSGCSMRQPPEICIHARTTVPLARKTLAGVLMLVKACRPPVINRWNNLLPNVFVQKV